MVTVTSIFAVLCRRLLATDGRVWSGHHGSSDRSQAALGDGGKTVPSCDDRPAIRGNFFAAKRDGGKPTAAAANGAKSNPAPAELTKALQNAPAHVRSRMFQCCPITALANGIIVLLLFHECEQTVILDHNVSDSNTFVSPPVRKSTYHRIGSVCKYIQSVTCHRHVKPSHYAADENRQQ